jgi:hypothetical protein
MRNFHRDVFQIVDAGAADSQGILFRPDFARSSGNFFGCQREVRIARFERNA